MRSKENKAPNVNDSSDTKNIAFISFSFVSLQVPKVKDEEDVCRQNVHSPEILARSLLPHQPD